MRCTSAKFFAIIASVVILVGAITLPAVSRAADTSALDMVDCGGFLDALTVSCFVPSLAYYVLYVPSATLLTLSGYIFDLVLALSIDHEFINQGFVGKLWGVIRDFSNMVFIFILLYTGIQTIFGLGKWQSTIIKVVVVALLVNFSMFFTKVVIDAGNILAVGVYESIGVVKNPGEKKPHKTAEMGSVKERSVSEALVNGFAPQQFAALSAENRGAATTIFIVSAIVCIYAAYIFIRVAILFIGRLIAFWFLIAISPFALISMTLPMKKVDIWEWWTNTLINQSFVAPVFLGFIYIIMAAIGGIENTSGVGEILGKGDPNGSYFDVIVGPVVLTIAVVYALQKALGAAKKMSDEFGAIGTKVVGTAVSSLPMGMAGGLVLGGGAALLRSQIGARAGKLLDSGKLQQMSSSPNSAFTRFTGRTLRGVAEKAHTSSFDARNTDAMKWALKEAGAKDGLGVKFNLGKGGGEGGYKKTLEQIEKDAKAQAEKMKVTAYEKEIEAGKMEPRYSKAKEQEEENLRTLDEAAAAHKEAESRANYTDESRKYKELNENIETIRSSFKSTEGNLVKKINDLNKQQAEERDAVNRDAIQRQITEAENERRRAKDDLDREEKKLTDAKEAYEATAEAKFLAEVAIAKKMAFDTYDRGQNIIRNTEKALEEWEERENRQRREASADNSMNSWFSSKKYYVPEADRMSVIKKIRKGDDKEKKKQEKMWKDMAKYVAEQQGKEEKPKPEPKEEEAKA